MNRLRILPRHENACLIQEIQSFGAIFWVYPGAGSTAGLVSGGCSPASVVVTISVTVRCNAELSREPATSDLVPPISWVERTRNSSGHPKRMLLLGKIFWPQAGFEPALRGA